MMSKSASRETEYSFKMLKNSLTVLNFEFLGSFLQGFTESLQCAVKYYILESAVSGSPSNTVGYFLFFFNS